MSSYPEGYRYTKDHEWVSVKGGIATVGITHHAQDALGDVVFVELPKPGTQVVQGTTFGTVESVKAVSELYAPISGEVLEANAALNDEPGTVNGDPHGAGWMIKVRLANPAEVESLLDAAAYAELVAS
jgi:glycine cleavage system H protein